MLVLFICLFFTTSTIGLLYTIQSYFKNFYQVIQVFIFWPLNWFSCFAALYPVRKYGFVNFPELSSVALTRRPTPSSWRLTSSWIRTRIICTLAAKSGEFKRHHLDCVSLLNCEIKRHYVYIEFVPQQSFELKRNYSIWSVLNIKIDSWNTTIWNVFHNELVSWSHYLEFAPQ